MKHLLAYGNSDQVSFRDPSVRVTFDYMTVPGTIASYYEDATAAFVLSSDLQYFIDPRTPLFQGRIIEPRASHRTLAAWMGGSVASVLNDASGPVHFDVGLYSEGVLDDVVTNVVRAQREYGGRSGGVAQKMGRYRRLLAEALGEEPEPVGANRAPSFILAPYFVAHHASDGWWLKNEQIWAACSGMNSPSEISPVVAVMAAESLGQLLDRVPDNLSYARFFWVSGFDERSASTRDLRNVRDVVEQRAVGYQLVNLYGGFFSIALSTVGLWGFNNGLGYSESRAWPELPATGAAPLRYYIPRLHSFFPPRLAQLIMDVSGDYWCPCDVCQDRVAGDLISIIDLSYHDVKKHFALCRAGELELVDRLGRDGVERHLREEFDGFESEVSPDLPPRLRPDVSYLHRWSIALSS